MMELLATALVIFGCLTSVSAQNTLNCYICARNDNCVNHTNSEIFNCYDEVGSNPTGIAITCFSAFLNYTSVVDLEGNSRASETGVYRGCGIISSNLGDYCTWYRAELGPLNITIPSCQSCNASLCNRHTFNTEDGSITGLAPEENGAYMITVYLALYVFSLGLIYISK